MPATRGARFIPNGGATLHDPDDGAVTLRDAKAMQ
jgi:hypothetical protein